MSELPADLTLRSLTPDDAPGAAAVSAATDRTYLEWMPEGWQPAKEEDERAYYATRIVEADCWSIGAFDPSGRLVAHAVMHQATDTEGLPIEAMGHVGELFVHPDRWREGIAAALMAHAEQEMRRRGYAAGRLRTPVGAPAIGFYESQGWSENGELNYSEQYDLHTIGFTKSLNDEGA